jgi:hypothetical protein
MDKPTPTFFVALAATAVLISGGAWFTFKPTGKELSNLVPLATKMSLVPDATGRLPVKAAPATEPLMPASTTAGASSAAGASLIMVKKAP